MIRSEIICDGCGIVGSAKGQAYGRWRAHVAREELRGRGWRVGKPRGTDYCQKCVAEDDGDCGWMANLDASLDLAWSERFSRDS